MYHWQGKQPIAVVSACMTQRGLPTLVLNEVEVTDEEAENGMHFYLVEVELLEAGYEEPFVHFDAVEGPIYLHAAVRQHLGLSTNRSATVALLPGRTINNGSRH